MEHQKKNYGLCRYSSINGYICTNYRQQKASATAKANYSLTNKILVANVETINEHL